MNMYFVASGLAGGSSGLTATLTAGVAYVAGVRVNSSGFSGTVVINQDTYVDMDQNGNFTQTGVANNAAAPSLTSGSIRLAVYVANGSAIVQVLQNTIAAPVAPRTATWFGFDSLGNPVYNVDPQQVVLGQAQITGSFTTTSGTAVQVTGLTVTVIIPAGGRKVKVTVFADAIGTSASGQIKATLWDGTVGSGTTIATSDILYTGAGSELSPLIMMAVVTPSAGSKTYNVGLNNIGGVITGTIFAGPTAPAFILVEAI